MPSALAPRPAAPRVLGRYQLRRRLGAGAFGTVWLAFDETLEREVAVKTVPRAEAGDEPGDGAFGGSGRRRDRAEREALAAARLNHPGIVALYEAGADGDAHYLVSELVEGVTLAQAGARGALSDRDVLRIGAALCDALEHAHAQGVIHRDIKPGNVIVPAEPRSEAGVAKLTDFGVAHLAGEGALTHTGDVVGTLAYMAPEQAEGRRVGPTADVYALALVLYEALAGCNPVRATAPAATARLVAAGAPSLRRLRRDLDPEVAGAIDRALRRRPEERGSLADLRAALRAALPAADDADGRAVIPPEDVFVENAAPGRGARLLRDVGLWIVPATAPLLAAAGVGAGFPVLAAALGRRTLRRAALGALGFGWVALAATLDGRKLHSGVLTGALLWAAAAATLPLFLRGRTVTAKVLGAALWAAAMVVAGELPGPLA